LCKRFNKQQLDQEQVMRCPPPYSDYNCRDNYFYGLLVEGWRVSNRHQLLQLDNWTSKVYYFDTDDILRADGGDGGGVCAFFGVFFAQRIVDAMFGSQEHSLLLIL
jgi:hypothetical protein